MKAGTEWCRCREDYVTCDWCGRKAVSPAEANREANRLRAEVERLREEAQKANNALEDGWPTVPDLDAAIDLMAEVAKGLRAALADRSEVRIDVRGDRKWEGSKIEPPDRSEDG